MTTSNKCSALQDVVAYVDVWSSDKTANYSKPFVQQLQEMGAQVSKTFSKQVTHVVFNNGHPATWRNAKKSGVRLVSVLWVGRCYDDGVCVDEDLYPAFNDESNPLLKNKKHRCMQPKDSPERTPENDRRMRKKLDKLMKDLAPKQPLVTDVSPVFIDEENGIVYSPALKRSDYMAQRLKDMKEKRENLSLTASQMVESCSPTGLKPSLGSTPPVFKLMYDQSDDESSASVAAPAYSPDKEEGRTQVDATDHDHLDKRHRKGSKKPWLSPCHDVPKRISSSVKFPDLNNKEHDEGNRQKDSIGTSVRKKPAEKHKSVGLLERPCKDRRSDNSKNFHKEKRRSQIKSSSPSPNKSEKGMRKMKAVKSFIETKTQFCSEAASGCLSSQANAAVELSKETAAPLQKIPKRARASISALVRSFTRSGDTKSVASGSTDGDDVFEDFFSPANHHQTLPLSNRPMKRDIQIPFELDSVPKKRKQRRSEIIVSETNSKKKRKLGTSQQSDASSEPQSHPQQDVKESLPALESPSGDVTLVVKRQRQSTLPFTSTRTTTSGTAKQRRTSASVQPTMFTNTISVLQKNSVNVPCHTLESRGNAHTAAAVLTEIPSEGEEENHNKQVSLSLQNMVNKTKAMRTLVMTSMPTEKQHTLAQVVTALGGFSIVDRVCESTTHVVSGGQRRTLNILLGIARGCWILSFEWILWCLEQRQWIPEEPYELSDQFPAAQFLFLDLSSPEAPVCRGAPAGPVPRPASHVCVPSLPATHSESGGADPALWRNSLQNCATGWYLHREVQRQETRGKQDPV
ncbi:microcephalin isoform X3 [Perca fluviatilis]|uniref:microcephalin isoform X3 n=1 Tax=Perca fluviatilis TaxID=8168 RepID=UPI001966A297|nr:microcephalin isoform X3 [Perca fluviatilis]XP_039640875.1 microcephalin isoform X3 [Perca fluviatilis]